MIYITSDTHMYDILNRFEKLVPEKDDTIIICGDCGVIWYPPRNRDELYIRDFMKDMSCRIAFIDGNHENQNRLDQLKKVNSDIGTYGQIDPNFIHLLRGHYYTIEGRQFFCFGGARSIDKYFRIENESWWAREVPSEEEFEFALDNIKAHDYKTDYVLTHTCPRRFRGLMLGRRANDFNDPTETMLDKFYEKLIFKKWYFGHWHQDRRINDRVRAIYEDILTIGDDLYAN